MSAFTELLQSLKDRIAIVFEPNRGDGGVTTADANPIHNDIVNAIELHANDQEAHAGSLPNAEENSVMVKGATSWYGLAPSLGFLKMTADGPVWATPESDIWELFYKQVGGCYIKHKNSGSPTLEIEFHTIFINNKNSNNEPILLTKPFGNNDISVFTESIPISSTEPTTKFIVVSKADLANGKATVFVEDEISDHLIPLLYIHSDDSRRINNSYSGLLHALALQFSSSMFENITCNVNDENIATIPLEESESQPMGYFYISHMNSELILSTNILASPVSSGIIAINNPGANICTVKQGSGHLSFADFRIKPKSKQLLFYRRQSNNDTFIYEISFMNNSLPALDLAELNFYIGDGGYLFFHHKKIDDNGTKRINLFIKGKNIRVRDMVNSIDYPIAVVGNDSINYEFELCFPLLHQTPSFSSIIIDRIAKDDSGTSFIEMKLTDTIGAYQYPVLHFSQNPENNRPYSGILRQLANEYSEYNYGYTDLAVENDAVTIPYEHRGYSDWCVKVSGSELTINSNAEADEAFIKGGKITIMTTVNSDVTVKAGTGFAFDDFIVPAATRQMIFYYQYDPITSGQCMIQFASSAKPLTFVDKLTLETAIETKVDKVDGKDLSANDYTTEDKSKVDNLPTNTNAELANKADLVGGVVPSAQLPAYVNDVLEYDNLASFPAVGESGKIYVDILTNKSYRWSGSVYVPIASDLALGETEATAYRGDRGKQAYDHSQAAHAPADAQKNSDITQAEIEAKLQGNINTHSHTVSKADVGLSNVNNTSDADKPISTAQQTEFEKKVDKVTGKGLSTEDYSTTDKGKVANVPADTNTELSNKLDKTTDVVEQYGTVAQTTIDILLDEGNWGAFNNEFSYAAQTPTELGLYPGLQLWDISGKYFYLCTDNSVFRCAKSNRHIENIVLPNSEAIGGEHDEPIAIGAEKIIFATDHLNAGEDWYDTINLVLPTPLELVYRKLKIILANKVANYATIINLKDSAGNILIADIAEDDIIEIESTTSKVYARKW